MKAIILAAGVGSRIRPLTDNCPKSLLKIGNKTILERMISNILDCGVEEFIFVTGYLEEEVKNHVKEKFPNLKAHFITNKNYSETNTGYSLMLTKDAVGDSDFVKFDADVVFDKAILEKLLHCPYKTALCVDKNIHLEAEEIKVLVDEENRVLKVSKTVDPKKAVGESIGIEKIGKETSKVLFQELETMMSEKKHHNEYYEGAYERLIENNVTFNTLDITGLHWVEIDTLEDFNLAKAIFQDTA